MLRRSAYRSVLEVVLGNVDGRRILDTMKQRTDRDTWDPSTSVGVTATTAAAARARATIADDAPIRDPFAAPLVRAVGIDFLTDWAEGRADLDGSGDGGAASGMESITELLVARTRYFDRFFADAGAAGIRQAVILAAGLDTRAYRLSWPTTTTLFELDQPAVLAFKATTLAGLNVESACDLPPSRSTYARTGRARWVTPASTRIGAPPGSPRDYWRICPPPNRTACSTSSPR
jgi:hypothetical protein